MKSKINRRIKKGMIIFSFNGKVIFTCPTNAEECLTYYGLDKKGLSLDSFQMDYTMGSGIKMMDLYTINNGHVLMETMIDLCLSKEVFDKSYSTVRTSVLA